MTCSGRSSVASSWYFLMIFSSIAGHGQITSATFGPSSTNCNATNSSSSAPNVPCALCRLPRPRHLRGGGWPWTRPRYRRSTTGWLRARCGLYAASSALRATTASSSTATGPLLHRCRRSSRRRVSPGRCGVCGPQSRHHDRPCPRHAGLHQARPPVRVSPGADEARGCALDGVPHPRRPLRVPGDGIRAMQCPGDVPRRDE